MEPNKRPSNQRWLSDDSTISRTGPELAKLLASRGVYANQWDALQVIQLSRIGDCMTTGVSGYQRIE